MTIPTVTDVPAIDTEQMREVDRLMVDEYGITLLQMMENAGRNLAHLARYRFFAGAVQGRRVTVLAGSGGNGGGAMVCARRLANYGAHVTLFLTKEPTELTGVPAQQLAILQRMAVPVHAVATLPGGTTPDLIIDGVIGYSLQGAPRGGAATLIRWGMAETAPILALDVPSGVEATTGRILTPAIQAMVTLTLALPKRGLQLDSAAAHTGELYLADISVPPALYARLGLSVGPIFTASDIVRLA